MAPWLLLLVFAQGAFASHPTFYDYGDAGLENTESDYVEDVVQLLDEEEQSRIIRDRDDVAFKAESCVEMCTFEVTHDDFGMYTWENTSVAFRRFVRCSEQPSFEANVLISRDCLLDNNGHAAWSFVINYTNCLKLPLVRIEEELQVARIAYSFEYWLTMSFRQILDALVSQKYRVILSPYAKETVFVYWVAFSVINDFDQLQREIRFADLINYLGFILHDSFVPAVRLQPQAAHYANRIFNELPLIASVFGPPKSILQSQLSTLYYASGFVEDLFNGILYLGYDMVVSAVPSTNCSYKLLAVDSEVFVEMDQTFRDQPLLDREARTVAKDVDYLFPRMVYVSMYDFQSGIQPQIKTSFTHPKLLNPVCAWNFDERVEVQTDGHEMVHDSGHLAQCKKAREADKNEISQRREQEIFMD
ncbi:hypothetical protein CAPTEDRAFT_188560 [Capitella teleta]|uniref:Uncharacterized protein n=1 Tax=Capitella teleta TaxID=283909 RepID=R7UHL1_CAPTE|nr:hypothetical protein CAPTEDRAFT_188560 [Capitella teleta]|eukprot:ELU06034.1 hypothetical protein CAPTEDRAFT_188560 [Capitella teleta]